MATSLSTLNRIKYAGLDFDSFEDEILARLQVNFASVYNDFAVSSIGIMLVDLFAYGLDTLAFYLDRRATDNFLSTCRTRKSAARAARQLGYKMGSAVASSVDVEVSLGQTYPFPITMPVGFPLKGQSGLTFVTQIPYTWPANTNSTATITCSEGQFLTATFTSDGTANQVFKIGNVPNNKFIVGPGTSGASPTVVEVVGDPWTESELLLFGPTDQFEIGYNDDPPTLRFGDGVAGNIPANGAEIKVTFFVSSGVNGKATSGTITDVVSPLVSNFTNISLVINNPEGTSGGSDPETIESVRANAPLIFKSRGVNITAQDYQARAGSFKDSVQGAIAVAHAVTVVGSAVDSYLEAKLGAIKGDAAQFTASVNTSSDALILPASETSDGGYLTQLAATLADIQDKMTLLEGVVDPGGVIDAGVATIDTSLISARSKAASAASSLTAQAIVISGTDANYNITGILNGITVGIADSITSATKTKFQNAIANAAGLSNNANGDIAIISGELTTIQSANSTTYDAINTGTVSTGAVTASIDAYLIDIGNLNASAASEVDSLQTGTDSIEEDVANLCDDISLHVNAFLSADCKANLVEVPVLTLDSDGFYAVPTVGLLKSLQTYLDSKKEVTQVVKVVGASNQLVPVDLTVECGVLPGYVEATVRASAEAIILNALKNRKFGKNLYLSELYGPVAPSTGAVEGLGYINIKIAGPSDHFEIVNNVETGNLVIQEYEVVTRGTITITSSVYTEGV